jgi:NADPH-dependent 2,4-dienoyl-CoA reductase/sulfur reductase-like enzyme
MNRRDFIWSMTGATLAAVTPGPAGRRREAGAAGGADPELVPTATGASGRVVVVGGGMAGATVAKYLRRWGGADVHVTLVEPHATYRSCILSNGVLDGTRTLSELTFGYDDLRQRHGVNVVQQRAVDVDPVARRVTTSGGRTLRYDRLVMAAGIDFDVIPGLESAEARALVPHAWKAGAQTLALRDQLRAMPAGGVVVLTIPPAPYRCPPGPYERACVIADFVKTRKPGSRVIVLDANPGIVAEKENFTRAFQVTHAGVVEYHAGVTISEIDATTLTVHSSLGSIAADVINAIPPQRAAELVAHAGLTNSGPWAGVDVLSYESTIVPDVHVIGDASATTQPKAGHIANSEAKVCADAITRLLRGDAVDPAPMTNSSCYTPITAGTASWLSVVFAYDPVTRTMKPVGGAPTESRRASAEQYEEMVEWYENLMSDTFA